MTQGAAGGQDATGTADSLARYQAPDVDNQ